MKNLVLGILSVCVLSSGCAKKSEVKVEDVGPRISDGYYAIDGAEKYNVPMVAVRKSDGVTYAYSFYWYECNAKLSSSYNKTGTTFSNSPVSLGGPHVTAFTAGQTCELKTDIVADSNSTIKIKVKLNGIDQESYNLKKVTKEEFVTGLNAMSKVSDSFRVSEDDCQKSLGESCVDLKIESKEE